MAFVTSICAVACGWILLGAALFGEVSAWFLPGVSAHVVLALLGIGAMAHGALR